MRAYLYSRVSTEEQVEGYSLDEQEIACREYAERQGWAVVDRPYRDEGISGKFALEERPAGVRLLADVAREPEGEAVIIVHRLDRFARSVVKGLGDFQTVTRGQSLVILDMAGLGTMDTSSPQGELMLTMLLAFAQFERRLIGERMEGGRQGKARAGGWSGGTVPLGYDSAEGGSLFIDEDEASTVRRIFSLTVDDGLTPYQVAASSRPRGGTRSSAVSGVTFRSPRF